MFQYAFFSRRSRSHKTKKTSPKTNKHERLTNINNETSKKITGCFLKISNVFGEPQNYPIFKNSVNVLYGDMKIFLLQYKNYITWKSIGVIELSNTLENPPKQHVLEAKEKYTNPKFWQWHLSLMKKNLLNMKNSSKNEFSWIFLLYSLLSFDIHGHMALFEVILSCCSGVISNC